MEEGYDSRYAIVAIKIAKYFHAKGRDTKREEQNGSFYIRIL